MLWSSLRRFGHRVAGGLRCSWRICCQSTSCWMSCCCCSSVFSAETVPLDDSTNSTNCETVCFLLRFHRVPFCVSLIAFLCLFCYSICIAHRHEIKFLCVTAAIAVAHLSHRNSVRPSVCPSHRWISQKRCKVGSPNS